MAFSAGSDGRSASRTNEGESCKLRESRGAQNRCNLLYLLLDDPGRRRLQARRSGAAVTRSRLGGD